MDALIDAMKQLPSLSAMPRVTGVTKSCWCSGNPSKASPPVNLFFDFAPEGERQMHFPSCLTCGAVHPKLRKLAVSEVRVPICPERRRRHQGIGSWRRGCAVIIK